MNARAIALAFLAAATGCRTDSARTTGPGGDTRPTAGGNVMTPRPRAGGAPGDGVPHSAIIERIELAADGTAALTRDTGASWRAWVAIDGSAQPQVVPARGARMGSLARRPGGGLLIAMVDSANNLRLFRTDERGRSSSIPVPASDRGVLQARVMPAGDQVVVLRDDHAVELVSDTGAVLGRIEKRGFRPAAIEVAAKGDRIIAVMVEPGTKKHDVSIHRIDVSAGAPSRLRLSDDVIRLSSPAAFGPGQLSLAHDGQRLAFLEVDSTQPWRLVVADLAARTTRSIDLPFQATEAVTAGFIDRDTLLASSAATATSWRIELGREGDLFPHPSPGNQFGNAAPHSFARGLRAAGVGNWLYVEFVGRDQLYLGYDRFEAIAGTISPKKNWAAWVSNTNGVYIRGLGTERPKRVHIPNRDPAVQVFRALFVDEDHLLLIDSTGGLRMVRWESNTEVAATDLGGGFGDVEIDPKSGLLRATRPGGQTWIYKVSVGKGLVGPLIVGDGGIRSGFLDGADVLWTLDGANKYRTYKLADIERGLSRKSVIDRGVVLEHASPAAIDRSGRFYVFYNDGRKTQVQRFTGSKRTSPQDAFSLSPTGFATVFPGQGGRLVIGRQDGVVSMFKAPGASPTWSRAFVAHLYGANYSQDGSLVAVSAHLGAAVLDTASGRPVDVTCGPWFEARRTAPSNAFGVLSQPNLCEADWVNE
jgi:hypothetical protein